MKIQGIGLPFSVNQSSCSSRTPDKFTWTSENEEVEVWVDMSIPEAIRYPKHKKRYAWICESKAIIPALRSVFDNEDFFNAIINSYDAIFTCERELVERHDKIHFSFAGSNLPWTKEYKIHNKTKLVSFISSSKRMCEGHKIRHKLYEKIKNDVDVFGSILGAPFGYSENCHLKNDGSWHNKDDALNDYMFSVVLENDQYDDYFTEKITDCFATGTIPIYWGTKNIGKYFNEDGIIQISSNLEEAQETIKNLTSDDYYDKINAVEDNFSRVAEMPSSDDVLFESIMKMEKSG